jgi:hypothetical protein
MAIRIRQADLELDRHMLIESLYLYLTKQSNEQRFDWLYTQNPYGHARAWVACDEQTEDVIGMAAAFPRGMRVGGKNLLCWVLGDFCIKDGFRSLGPALLLQRACLSAVEREEIPFCYDFPSQRMMAIYKRLGMVPVGHMYRFVKPLRVDHKVQEVFGAGLLARSLSSVSNQVLAWRDHLGTSSKGWEISFHTGCFGEEFSDLEHRMLVLRHGVCGRRTAASLNWRYGANPVRHYEIMTARQRGELHAYVVFTHSDRGATLTDVVGLAESGVLEDLLAAVIATLREREVLTVSAPLLDSRWLPAVLKRAGFYARESRPVVAYVRAGGPCTDIVTAQENWFLSDGDRDM